MRDAAPTSAPHWPRPELFFMTCYDIDRFRSFVASDSFSTIYDLPVDEMHAMLLDDVLLMQFGFRFLRQVLFGEVSIAMHEQSAQQRRDALMLRRQQIELEAAERRARDEDAADFVDI